MGNRLGERNTWLFTATCQHIRFIGLAVASSMIILPREVHLSFERLSRARCKLVAHDGLVVLNRHPSIALLVRAEVVANLVRTCSPVLRLNIDEAISNPMIIACRGLVANLLRQDHLWPILAHAAVDRLQIWQFLR